MFLVNLTWIFIERILLQRICWIYMGNPLRWPNKSGKGCFCTAGICKCTVVFKLKIYNLQMFSRPSDIKCSFVSSNFVLFRIIRTAEVAIQRNIQNPVEHLRWSFLHSFHLSAIFIKSSILDIRLGFEYASE